MKTLKFRAFDTKKQEFVKLRSWGYINEANELVGNPNIEINQCKCECHKEGLLSCNKCLCLTKEISNPPHSLVNSEKKKKHYELVKKWRKLHLEKFREIQNRAMKNWRMRNPNKVREIGRKSYLKYRDRYLAYFKEYYKRKKLLSAYPFEVEKSQRPEPKRF